MRSLIIKTTVHGMDVTTSLGDPRAQIGDYADASLQLRRIKSIPANTPNIAVLLAFKGTIDATAYSALGQRLEFDFDELGIGKLIKV